MYKKHYIIFAKVIKNSLENNHNLERFVEDLVEELYLDNQNFNKDKFLEACGMKD